MLPESDNSPIHVLPNRQLGHAELTRLAADVAAAYCKGTLPQHREAHIKATGRDLESLTASLDAELVELQKLLASLNIPCQGHTAKLLDFVAEVRRLSDLVSHFPDVAGDGTNRRKAVVEADQGALTVSHAHGMVTFL